MKVSYLTNEPARNARGQVTKKHLPEMLTGRPRAGHAQSPKTAPPCGKLLPDENSGQGRSALHGAPARFSAPPRGAEKGHPGQTSIREKKK